MKFNYSFNQGPFIELRDTGDEQFLVEYGEFYMGDYSSPRFLLDLILKGNCTYGIFREWHTHWFINIFQNNDKEGLRLVSSHRYNDSQKNVAIILDTDDLYEARIWLDKCIQYQNKTNANVFVFTKFYSFLHQLGQANVRVCPPEAYFKDPIHKTAYNLESENKFDIPDLSSKEFTWKDDVGYYASYRVGRYSMKEYGLDKFGHHLKQDQGLIREHWWKQYESFRNPVDWAGLTSGQIADHILGLDPIGLEEKLASLKKHKYLDI